VFHLYVVRSHKRDELYKFLRSKDIGVLIHYPVPIHLQPAYKDRLKGYNSLPETEKASKEVLSLPIFPELSEETIGLVSKTIRDFERGNL
jgi:dTDP-4-amino-4,6-dideoxygalactose transaminase